ncbi:MAG: response regulator transcription factor [Dialister sp.]|jgi:DNA-binding response OmpR family regulator|nr:response regulator transcription factor [Dialister sp.]
MRKVLVVEDEQKIANMERDFLEGAGFEPYVTDNGEEALKIMDEVKIDAIILDVMLPGEDGFSLCRKMREKTDAPIIFATARTEDADIVRGLGLGADDYIVKPFKGTVLMAHLRAQLATHNRLLSRDLARPQVEKGITVGDVTICPKARQVLLNGKDVTLTGKEFDLLYFLVQHPNEVFSKEQLFEKIWSFDPIGDPATVTVHINRLRDKLKNAAGHPYEGIETVWGAGYRFHQD